VSAAASNWCERWRDRRHSWRHRSEGAFNASQNDVAPARRVRRRTCSSRSMNRPRTWPPGNASGSTSGNATNGPRRTTPPSTRR
jgi:hypothetical protein